MKWLLEAPDHPLDDRRDETVSVFPADHLVVRTNLETLYVLGNVLRELAEAGASGAEARDLQRALSEVTAAAGPFWEQVPAVARRHSSRWLWARDEEDGIGYSAWEGYDSGEFPLAVTVKEIRCMMAAAQVVGTLVDERELVAIINAGPRELQEIFSLLESSVTSR